MDKLTRKEAFSLAMDAYNRKSSNAEYTAEEREEGLRNYLADLAKDYRANKNEIYQIIESVVNEVLPKRVLESVKNFAEFKQFDNNTEVKFKAKNGKIKAVEVALGGHVERVRLDRGYFTLKYTALQAKAYEEYERILGGQTDFNEYINGVVDAINEAILVKVYDALKAVYAKLPTPNKHTATTFEQAEFDKILNVVRSYGTPVIMGTANALGTIPLSATASSEADKVDFREMGYLGKYKGVNVVELPQSFDDSDNLTKTIDDQYIFIVPAGQEKIVKVGMVGTLITKEENGADWTVNFEAYQKVSVGLLAVNNIGIYKNTSLA